MPVSNIYLLNTYLIYLYFTFLKARRRVEATSSKCHLLIRSSSYENFFDSYRATEPQNTKVRFLSWTGLGSYIRMNSHICDWLPSFRVAIIWRRREIDKMPEVKSYGHAPRNHPCFHVPPVHVDSERCDSRP